MLETLEVGRAPDITVGEYPEYNLLDLRNVPNASYDIVVSDQVLEHLEGDPQWAFNETHRVLTSGGIAIHTTCFFTEIHGGLDRETGEFRDNHRFTPRELRRLARQFRTIIAAGAGHKLWYFGFRYLDVPHATWHPIHKIAMLNNPATPYGVWVIAQK